MAEYEREHGEVPLEYGMQARAFMADAAFSARSLGGRSDGPAARAR
ncbi:hypothetical protein [Actinomadura geliboluensis]